MRSRMFLILSGILGIIVNIILYFFLPDKVAIHFNFLGQPDSYAVKAVNLIIWFIVFIFFNLLWFLIPILVKKSPKSFVNIPNRDYWLAEERKEETAKKVSNWMNIFGIIINIFLICVCFIMLDANLQSVVKINYLFFYPLLILFFVVFIIWIVLFVKAFGKKKDS